MANTLLRKSVSLYLTRRIIYDSLSGSLGGIMAVPHRCRLPGIFLVLLCASLSSLVPNPAKANNNIALLRGLEIEANLFREGDDRGLSVEVYQNGSNWPLVELRLFNRKRHNRPFQEDSWYCEQHPSLGMQFFLGTNEIVSAQKQYDLDYLMALLIEPNYDLPDSAELKKSDGKPADPTLLAELRDHVHVERPAKVRRYTQASKSSRYMRLSIAGQQFMVGYQVTKEKDVYKKELRSLHIEDKLIDFTGEVGGDPIDGWDEGAVAHYVDQVPEALQLNTLFASLDHPDALDWLPWFGIINSRYGKDHERFQIPAWLQRVNEETARLTKTDGTEVELSRPCPLWPEERHAFKVKNDTHTLLVISANGSADQKHEIAYEYWPNGEVHKKQQGMISIEGDLPTGVMTAYSFDSEIERRTSKPRQRLVFGFAGFHFDVLYGFDRQNRRFPIAIKIDPRDDQVAARVNFNAWTDGDPGKRIQSIESLPASPSEVGDETLALSAP